MLRASLLAVSVFIFGLGLGAGCAHTKKDQTVCPEYRDLRCATGPDCTFDAARGCKVCVCADVTGGAPEMKGANEQQRQSEPPLGSPVDEP